jgi:hypothetical protein
VWRRPSDWYHPAVDALIEAVLAGSDPCCAAGLLGMARGRDGVGIAESIDDVSCLFRSIGVPQPPLAVVRALCQGWADAQGAAVGSGSCIDAESGLPTRDYLETRLIETYGLADEAGSSAQVTRCLLLVDVATEELSPWVRMARSAAVGAALRAVYVRGHPMATLGNGLFAVLVERGVSPGNEVRTIRAHVAHQADLLGIKEFVRQPPRIWVEPLPRTHDDAVMLLSARSR